VLIVIFQPLPSPAMEIPFAGQGEGKHGYPGLLFDYSFDLRDNAGNIVKFFILQPQNPHPKLIKEKRPIIVIFFLVFVNSAVKLNRQFLFMAIKVGDIVPYFAIVNYLNWMLPVKFITVQFVVT
jgi:hypothetical protein